MVPMLSVGKFTCAWLSLAEREDNPQHLYGAFNSKLSCQEPLHVTLSAAYGSHTKDRELGAACGSVVNGIQKQN